MGLVLDIFKIRRDKYFVCNSEDSLRRSVMTHRVRALFSISTGATVLYVPVRKNASCRHIMGALKPCAVVSTSREMRDAEMPQMSSVCLSEKF
jgi:hypothetical protein